MPRYTYTNTDTLSPKRVTVGVLALAIILFLAIVFWPSGAARSGPPLDASKTALGAKLNDPLTHSFLETLHQVDPSQSQALHQTAEAVLAEGGTEEDLALEIVAVYGIDPFRDFEHLAQSDVTYVEKMLTLAQTELSSLSIANSKYCKFAAFEALDQMEPEAMVDEFGKMFGYNSRAYKWMLRFGIVQMQAIQDGRDNPKKYKRMSREDGLVLQEELMRLMKRRSLTQLMRQGQGNEKARRNAMKTANMCEIGADVLSAVNRLPSDLKGRMMVEMWRLRKKSAIKALGRELFGDSCRTCARIF